MADELHSISTDIPAFQRGRTRMGLRPFGDGAGVCTTAKRLDVLNELAKSDLVLPIEPPKAHEPESGITAADSDLFLEELR
jgi:hypothetical protein